MGNKRRKKGNGTLRQRSDGRWEGRLIIAYDDVGKPKYKSVFAATKTECNEKLKNLRETITVISGRLPSKTKPNMPFGEWIDIWYQSYEKPRVRVTTQANLENLIYNHIIPSVGKIQLDKLTQQDLQQFYGDLKKGGRLIMIEQHGEGVSDRTVRGCHAMCRKCLEKAEIEGLIYKSPAVGIKLPPKKAREIKILTPEEMQRFLMQAHYEGFYELFLLELSTGMRRGEILGLKWDDLDLKTGALHIQRQVTTSNGKAIVSEPKTKASIRTIILNPSIIKVLTKYKDTVKSEWIFPSPVKENAPFHPQSIYKKTQQILERSGCKRVRFHDLRHTFATMALSHGMDIKTLSSTIGHISAETTLDIYSHITDSMLKTAAVKIESGIGRSDPNLRNEIDEVLKKKLEPPKPIKYDPYKGKVRKSGTGGIYKLNDHLYEGRYTPTNADGKREAHNIYAHTLEECEEKLQQMIEEVRAQIAVDKERKKHP